MDLVNIIDRKYTVRNGEDHLILKIGDYTVAYEKEIITKATSYMARNSDRKTGYVVKTTKHDEPEETWIKYGVAHLDGSFDDNATYIHDGSDASFSENAAYRNNMGILCSNGDEPFNFYKDAQSQDYATLEKDANILYKKILDSVTKKGFFGKSSKRWLDNKTTRWSYTQSDHLLLSDKYVSDIKRDALVRPYIINNRGMVLTGKIIFTDDRYGKIFTSKNYETKQECLVRVCPTRLITKMYALHDELCALELGRQKFIEELKTIDHIQLLKLATIFP